MKKTGNFNRCVMRANNQVAKEMVFQKMFREILLLTRKKCFFKLKEIHPESLTWIRGEPHGGGDVGPQGCNHGEGGGGVHQGRGGSGHRGAADTRQQQQGRQHRDHQAYLRH